MSMASRLNGSREMASIFHVTNRNLVAYVSETQNYKRSTYMQSLVCRILTVRSLLAAAFGVPDTSTLVHETVNDAS